MVVMKMGLMMHLQTAIDCGKIYCLLYELHLLEEKNTGPRPAKIQSDRLHKGEDDQIQTFNKYGALDDMDVDHVAPLHHRTTSASPRRGRLRSPIQIP